MVHAGTVTSPIRSADHGRRLRRSYRGHLTHILGRRDPHVGDETVCRPLFPSTATAVPDESSTQDHTWLEVDGGWQGRVILPDSGTNRCSHQQVSSQRWFEAVTSEFAEFESGSANPGSEFEIHATADVEPRPERATQSETWVVGTLVDAAGAHVQFHSTDEIELEVRDDGRQVAFALTATGSGLDIDDAPITVRGVIICSSVTES